MRRGVLGCMLVALGAVASDRPPLPRDELPRPLFQGVPAGLPPIEYPDGGGYDERHIELGRRLFFDPVLSLDRDVSCATCHQPEHAFSTPEALPQGVRGQRALTHPPTLLNRAYGRFQRWDGLAESLEDQVLLPIENPIEMGLTVEQALERLQAEGDYGDRFEAAFDGGLGAESLATALASFVRHLVVGDSPVDRFRAGEIAALNPEERAGLWLFESKGGCWRCHEGVNFSDESFHNTGVGAQDGVPEEGRFAVTGREEDRGAFKTPTLRAAARRGPFMHDGSLATLREVVEFYRDGGRANSHLDPQLQPLDLDDAEVGRLVAFLEALSR